MELFLNFLMKQNTVVIEVLITITLFIMLFIAYRSFIVEKEEPQGNVSGMDLSGIEETLRKVLEKTNAEAPVAASAPEQFSAEIDSLKAQLSNKNAQIAELETKLESAGSASVDSESSLSSENKSQLEKETQDLRAKLEEYEIIAEDIADLSFYKEQTTKLKKEVEDLKAQLEKATSATASAEPSVAVAAPAPTAQSQPEKKAEPSDGGGIFNEDLMAEFAAAVNEHKTQTPTAPPPPPESAAAAPAPPTPSSDEAEFNGLGQQDIDKMLQSLDVAPAPTPASTPSTLAAEPIPDSTPTSQLDLNTGQADVDKMMQLMAEGKEVVIPSSEPKLQNQPETPSEIDMIGMELMAEFSAAVKDHKDKKQDKPISKVAAAIAAKTNSNKPSQNPTPPHSPAPTSSKVESVVDLGQMNIDKMMQEASVISVADGPEISAEQALGKDLDENKLLQEATQLVDPKVEDLKLMDDFEDFMRKSGQ